MKIKRYKNINNKWIDKEEPIYWKVNLKEPYFKMALKEIGMNDEDINFFNDMLTFSYEPYIFIVYDGSHWYWHWNDTYEHIGRYMGDVGFDYEQYDKYNL